MTGMQNCTPTRRTLLAALGTGIATTAIASDALGERQTTEYALVQGDRCVPIQPVRGQEPVEAFYGYELPDRFVSDENGAIVGDSAQYASAGTTELQRARKSIAFLYRGPERLSLVVVHGSAEADDGGSVTFTVSGLPADGEWLVKDDIYRDPSTGELAATNYDNWEVEGTDHRIDWTWGSAGTDGGAFGGLGDDFEVVVEPAFNESAALYEEHYEGTVTDWEFLSGPDGGERIPLEMDDAIRIATGRCDDDSSQTTDERGSDRREEETDGDRGDQQEETEDDADEDGADEEGDDGPFTVCHRPPGNPDNAKTIEVGSEAALEAHLDHGDTRGPCDE